MQEPSDLTADGAKYSQVSGAAIIALLLGLASLLAFVGPLFFVFPVAAVGVALVALANIRRSEGTLAGALLARIAIALALGCVAASLVRGSVRDTLMQRQAVEAAKQWLELLAAGRIPEARALMTRESQSGYVPVAVGTGHQKATPEQINQLIVNGLRNDVLTLALAGQEDPGVLESVSPLVFDGGRATIALQFGVEDSRAGGHRHVELQLVRVSAYEREGRPWRVDRWQAGEAHGAH